MQKKMVLIYVENISTRCNNIDIKFKVLYTKKCKIQP